MNFKLSQNKIILLVIAVSAVLAAWFLVIAPKWHINIENKIKAANYCEIDSDCAGDYFKGLTCGSYINKKELESINKEINLYHLTTFDYTGCMGGVLSTTPVCENKKCIGAIGD